jgi:hypothetical protein
LSATEGAIRAGDAAAIAGATIGFDAAGKSAILAGRSEAADTAAGATPLSALDASSRVGCSCNEGFLTEIVVIAGAAVVEATTGAGETVDFGLGRSLATTGLGCTGGKTCTAADAPPVCGATDGAVTEPVVGAIVSMAGPACGCVKCDTSASAAGTATTTTKPAQASVPVTTCRISMDGFLSGSAPIS